MRAYSPTGSLIVQTLEVVPATSGITPNSFRMIHGELDFDWDGNTEIEWNDQKTVMRENQRVFVDEEGLEWLESQLVLRKEEENAA